MKYYVYISDSKIDMLYPQIPKPLLRQIASNLNIDLKFFGAEVSVAGKNNPSDEMRYSKVKIVSEYIEKHLNVGSIDAPGTYFKGKLSMQQGILKDQAIYFGGETTKTVLGLSGSLQHVIGGVGPKILGGNGSLLYAIEHMIKVVTSESQLIYNDTTFARHDSIEGDIEQDTLVGVAYLTLGNKSSKQHFEFLAKTLLQGLSYTKNYVVLGTPIYVAIDD